MNDPTYQGQGAVQSDHPLAGSGASFDHDAHRQEVFGDYRDMDVRGPREDQQRGGRKGHAVGRETAMEVYETYWTSNRSQRDVGEQYGLDHRTVGDIANRERHFHEKTAAIAARLGYPDQGEA